MKGACYDVADFLAGVSSRRLDGGHRVSVGLELRDDGFAFGVLEEKLSRD